MAASNKCVIVLAPNGRRQNVKVTPNTTILQILEEVCKKQGFNAEEYDIKHHNHMLDITSLMRFSGLPNNAQLEMALASKAREESNVFLGLQLESGDRLTGEFLPADSLWDVIKRLCPDEADPESNPVVIYMRREVQGAPDLEKTTLRSLGLTGGRAMLRYFHRTPEQLHHQANVYHLQQLPTVVAPVLKRPRPSSDAPPEQPKEKPVGDVNLASPCPMEVDVEPLTPVVDIPKPAVHVWQGPGIKLGGRVSMLTADESYDTLLTESLGGPSTSQSSEVIDNVHHQTEPVRRLEEEIILLGERNALIFSLAMAQSVPCEDLPEDFYDLTLEDARALYRDIKKRRAEIEEAPLVTSAFRNLEESSRVLSHLGTYKRTVLRIEFPDRTVLQGTFLPVETVGMVMEFVRSYLQDPTSSFHLFLTPPKRVLAPDDRLVEVNCVPSALLHFGLDRPDQLAATYLREEFLTRLTSPSGAALAACQSRGLVQSVHPVNALSKARSTPSTSTAAGVTSSVAGATLHRELPAIPGPSRQPQPRQDSGPATKMPKWFKPLGK